jgi:uncharacterized protein (TIGR02246 family)
MSGPGSSESDEIAASLQCYVEAARAGDVAALVSLHCEDAVLMPPNETSLYGRAEVKEWYEKYLEHFRLVTLSETERQVRILNDWAIVVWSYTVAIAPTKGGERIRDDGRFFMVWKREPDGAWRISHAMFNSIRPIGSGTSRFLSRMSQRRSET